MYLDAFDGKMVDALTEQNLLKSEFSNVLARIVGSYFPEKKVL